MTGQSPSKSRHAVIISNSVIQTDPRVRKWAKTLHQSGWRVSTFGLSPAPAAGERNSNSLSWEHFDLPHATAPDRAPNLVKKVLTLLVSGRLFSRAYYYFGLLIGLRISPKQFLGCFDQSDPIYGGFTRAIEAKIETADLWIANDWDMLPIAETLRASKGGQLWYDSHEFATEQFEHDRQWRRWRQPLIRAVESQFIKNADHVSTVSSGLCTLFHTRYNLQHLPQCIRNMPPYQSVKAHDLEGPLNILYQGVVMRGRGLEGLINSVPYWTFDGVLTIRGPHYDPVYFIELQRLIEKHNVVGRVKILPPIAPSDMVSGASKYDIGAMLLEKHSAHNIYALPNKVFEYTMAGLALLISDNPDMVTIINEHKNGICVDTLNPESVAARLNAWTLEDIKAARDASIRAAKDLNWETEQMRLLDTADKIVKEGTR